MKNSLKALALSLLLTGAIAAAAAGEPRKFPANTRLGTLEIGVFPKATLNGAPITMAPGARVHDRSNRIAIPSTLRGEFEVRYRLDLLGQVHEAWILTPEELRDAQRSASR